MCVHDNRPYGDFHIRQEALGQLGSSPKKLIKCTVADLTSAVSRRNHSLVR